MAAVATPATPLPAPLNNDGRETGEPKTYFKKNPLTSRLKKVDRLETEFYESDSKLQEIVRNKERGH